MAKMTMAEKLAANVKPLKEETVDVVPAAGEDTPSLDVSTQVVPSENSEQETVRETAQPATASPKRTTAVKKRKAPEPAAAPTQESSSAVQLIVELPDSVNKRLEAYRAKTSKSHTVVLYDAVERVYEQLPELIRAELGIEESPATVRLFERSIRTSTPVPTGDKEPTVTHSIRVTSNNRRDLTELAERFGAPSRNFMLVVAYKAFLPEL